MSHYTKLTDVRRFFSKIAEEMHDSINKEEKTITANIDLLWNMEEAIQDLDAILDDLEPTEDRNERYRDALLEIAAPPACAMDSMDRVEAMRDLAREATKENRNDKR